MSIELVDTSVWARRQNPGIRSWFATALAAREIGMCDMVAMEVLRGIRAADYTTMAANFRAASPWIQMDAAGWLRATEVQALLTGTGTQAHRAVKVTDLLIAAAAERVGIPVVHYDQHFEIIASVTGQAVRWVAPRGTLG